MAKETTSEIYNRLKAEGKNSAFSSNSVYGRYKKLKHEKDYNALSESISALNPSLQTALGSWQDADTMANTKTSLGNALGSLNNYKTAYGSMLDEGGMKNIDNTISSYQELYDNWDKLSNSYSTAKSKEEYERLLNPNAEQPSAFENYRSYMDNADYAEKSQIPEIVEAGSKYSTYLNKNKVQFKNMTAEQAQMFYYLLNTDEKLAKQYLNDITPEINKTITNNIVSDATEWANKNMFTQGIATAGSILGNFVGGVGAVTDDFQNILTTGTFDTNSLNRLPSTVSEEVQKSIASKYGSVGGFLYNVTMSIANSALNVATFGKYGIANMAMQAYASASRELKEAGATDAQALVGGIVSGSIEALTEKYSVDNLLKPKSVSSISKWLKETAKQFATEASEEGASEILNDAWDLAMGSAGGYSEILTNYNQLRLQGMSEKEAFSKTFGEKWLELGLAMLAGGISGGIMGGVSNMAQYSDNKATGSAFKYTGNFDTLNEVASKLDVPVNVTADSTPAEIGANIRDTVIKAYEDKNINALNKLNYSSENEVVDLATGKKLEVQGMTLDGDDIKLNTSKGSVSLDEVLVSGMESAIDLDSIEDKKLFVDNYTGGSIGAYYFAFENAYNRALYNETEASINELLQQTLASNALNAKSLSNIYSAGVKAKYNPESIRVKNAVANMGKKKGSSFDYSQDFSIDGKKKGKIDFDSLTDEQKNEASITMAFASSVKAKVRWYDSKNIDENDSFKEEKKNSDGYFKDSSNTIWIDINSQKPILIVFSHELTHWMKGKSPELYRELQDYVLDYQSKKQKKTVNELIYEEASKIARYRKYSQEKFDTEYEKLREEAVDEIVARSCEDMLTNSEYASKLLENMKPATKKSFIEKVVDFINKTLKNLKEFLSQFSSNSKEAKLLREDIKAFQEISKKWDALLKESVKVTKAIDNETSTKVSNKSESEILKSEKENIDVETEINQTMTMKQAKDMVQRAFVIGDVLNWYDGEYKNGDEWLKGEGSGAVAEIIENDYSMQSAYINSVEGILEERFSIESVIDAYSNGTLTGKIKEARKDIDTSNKVRTAENKFYSPREIEKAQEKFEVAKQRITKANKDEVMQARADILLYSHNKGAVDTLGISQKEMNKLLRSWGGYSANSREISERINKNVDSQNRWTGIENLSWLNRARITNDDVARMVNSITNKGSDFEVGYIARTMLALDTHLDWSWLNIKFASSKEIIEDHGGGRCNGFYRDDSRLIEVSLNSPYSLSHEMGHSLDCQWYRELTGKSISNNFLTEETSHSYFYEKLKDEKSKQFAKNFKLFTDTLRDSSAIGSEYEMDIRETFARFIDAFCRWVEKTATGYGETYGERWGDRKDNFKTSQYIEFAKLLQEKASLNLEAVNSHPEVRFSPKKENTWKSLSSDDLELFERKIASVGRIENQPKSRDGKDYILQINNKLVYTDADIEYPQISMVVEFNVEGETDDTINSIMRGAWIKYEQSQDNKRLLYSEYARHWVDNIYSGEGKEANITLHNRHNSVTYERDGRASKVQLHKSVKGNTGNRKERSGNITEVRRSSKDSNGTELTEAQIDYFKDSVVRDANGNLLVMYHGTPAYDEITKFKKGKHGYLGAGMYFTNDKSYANKYANSYGEGTIYEVYLNVKNPLVVTDISNVGKEILGKIYGSDKVYNNRIQKNESVSYLITNVELKKLSNMGYDGILWRTGRNDYEVSVWNQNAIKRTDNFNPTDNPDIRYSSKDSASLTEERIDNLIEDYGASNPEYAKAYIATISPRDFLKLTLTDKYLPMWDKEAELGTSDEYYSLNAEELRRNTQTPFLEIVDGEVVGHEGRHRMRALLRAGINSVPIVVRENSTKYSKRRHDSMILKSQDFGDGNINDGAEVEITKLIPLNKIYRGEILEKYSSEDSGIRYSLKEVEPVMPSSNEWRRSIDTNEALKRFPNLWNVSADESEDRNPTQNAGTVGSYRKIYDILKSEGFSGKILDASSGLGYGTKIGREEYGFDVEDIEPYPSSNYVPKYKDYSKLNKKYDVVINNAVLNVLPQDQRDALVVKMGELVKDGGRIFINTRGYDVMNSSSKQVINADEWEVYIGTSGSYQKGFKPNELKAYIQDALGEGFIVEKTNKFGKTAVVVTKDLSNIDLSLADSRYSSKFDNINSPEDADRVLNELYEENKALKRLLEIEKELTNEVIIDETKLDVFVNEIYDFYRADKNDKESCKRLLRNMYSQVKGDADYSFEDFKKQAKSVAGIIIDSSPKNEIDQYAQQTKENLKKYFKGVKLKLNENQKKDLESASGMNWHKSLFGRINTANDGQELDTFYNEMLENNPELKEYTLSSGLTLSEVNDADQAVALWELVNYFYADQYISWNTAMTNSAIEDLSNRIIDELWEITPTKSLADKYEAKINNLNKEYKKKLETLKKKIGEFNDKVYKEKYQKQYDEMQKKYQNELNALQGSKDRLLKEVQELKEKKGTKVTKEDKEELRTKYRDRYNELYKRKVLKDSLKKKVDRLSLALEKNDSQLHCPEVIKKPLGRVLLTLDFTSGRRELTKNDVQAIVEYRKLKEAFETAMKQNDAMTDEYFDFSEEFIIEMQDVIETLDALSEKYKNEANIVRLLDSTRLKEINDVLTALNRSIYQTEKSLNFQKRQKALDRAESSISYLDKFGDRSVKRTVGNWVEAHLHWNNILPAYMFDRFGRGGQEVFDEFRKANDKYAFLISDIQASASRMYTDEEASAWYREVKTVKIDGKEYKMTVAQIMYLYELNKREGAKQHLYKDYINHEGQIGSFLVKGEGMVIGAIDGVSNPTVKIELTADAIEKITNTLTPRQKEVADSMQRYLATTCAKWGNYISMHRWGILQFTEEAYMPMRVYKEGASLKNQLESAKIFALLNRGFTKSLNDKANGALIIDDIFSVFAQHAQDMAVLNCFGLPVLDMYAWMGYKRKVNGEGGNIKNVSLKEQSDRVYGPVAMKALNNYLEDLNGISTNVKEAEKIGRFLLRNYKASAVAGNLRVALMQPIAIIRATRYIDNKYIQKALVTGIKELKEVANRQKTYSGISKWKNELGQFDNAVAKELAKDITKTDNKLAKTYRKVMDLTMKPAGFMDEITWTYLYKACELEIKETTDLKGNDFNEAVADRFSDIVHRTQVVNTFNTRSLNMKDKSWYMQIFTAFMSEPTVSYSMLEDEWFKYELDRRTLGTKASFKKHRREMLKSFMAVAVTALCTSIIASLPDIMRDGVDDDRPIQQYLKTVFENFLQEMTSFEPFSKELSNMIISGYSASRSELAFIDSFQKATKSWTDGKFTYNDVYRALKFVSQATGAPLSNLLREVQTVWDNTIGEIYPSLRWKDKK